MLHNSGAYGPNDTPINANTPVNMSQGSSPLNINRNLQSLSDIAQQPLRDPSGHYTLPNYPTYGLDSLDMRTHLSSFSSHHLKGYPSDYPPGNSSAIPHMRWQNGMAPLNLNAQSTYVPSLPNYHMPYEKQQPNSTIVSSDIKHVNSQEEDNLITPNDFAKASTSENYFYNSHLESYNHYNQNDASNFLKERHSLDISKRKSLENTVKLIENILINTNKDTQNNASSSDEAEPVKNNVTQEKSQTLQENKVQETLEPQVDPIKDVAENYCTKKDKTLDITENQPSDTKAKPDISFKDIKSSSILPGDVFNKSINIKKPEKFFKEPKIKIEISVDPIQHIKQEIGDLNTDYNNHFTRDMNGVSRENISDESLIISDNSVEEAKSAVNNVTALEYYYECPHCALLFNHVKRFLIHVKWHTFGLTNEKRMFEAREREFQKKQRKEARLVDQVQKNITKSKEKVEDPNATYTCKDCPKIFVSKGSLKNHRTRSHSNKIRECSVCNATVLGWAQLKAHEATHDAPYNCEQCGKVFRHKHSLARHAETHMEEKEKTLRCETCGKTFAILARFKEHQRGHVRAERGPIYQCTYCAKSFTQSYSLTIHERTHRGEKPYTCTICNTSYGTNSSLKRHLKVSHNSSKPYECSICGRCFSSERALNAHTVRLHSFEQTGDPLAPKKRKRNRNGPKKEPKEFKEMQKQANTKQEIKESEHDNKDMVT
ncbi:hypothetical protein O0L34_g12070 [Tuta absoluta]|nr:hypothetical protein O0L34_g12070 [Tuta absoluta]